MKDYKELLELIEIESSILNSNHQKINNLIIEKFVSIETTVVTSEEHFNKDIHLLSAPQKHETRQESDNEDRTGNRIHDFET